MRLQTLACVALGSLSAGCAVLPAQEAPALALTVASDLHAGLPPQHLTPGACGLFVWTAVAPHRLLLFEDESLGRAQVWSGERAVGMAVERLTAAPEPGLALARHYRYADTGTVAALSGRIEASPEGGQRLVSAVLRLREGAGAYAVQPVSGLRVCPAYS